MKCEQGLRLGKVGKRKRFLSPKLELPGARVPGRGKGFGRLTTYTARYGSCSVQGGCTTSPCMLTTALQAETEEEAEAPGEKAKVE